MDFPFAHAQRQELKSWEHNTICTFPKNVAEKRSNNKLKSWPNIRCRVRARVCDDFKKTQPSRRTVGEKKRKEIMHTVSQRVFGNPCSAGKCLLSYGIALKWYIPEGKESHFVCITLKRSQEEQTGMRELENHGETGGLTRRSEKKAHQSEP